MTDFATAKLYQVDGWDAAVWSLYVDGGWPELVDAVESVCGVRMVVSDAIPPGRVMLVAPHGHAPDGTPIVSAVVADFDTEDHHD